MKTVLIIGGNRFVGKALSKVLLEKNYSVDVFNRSGTSADSNINIIKGNRNNEKDVDKIDFTKYECIVDMCLFFPSQFQLIKNKISKDTNYIFVSSGAADKRYVELFGDYGRDKLEIEEMIKLSDINFDIIRPSYIVGINNHRPRLGYFIDRLANNKTIEVAGNGKNLINIVFVEDVVEVLKKLVLRHTPKMKTYNVSSDKSWSVMELIFIIKEKFFQDIDEIKVSHDRLESLFCGFDFELNNTDIRNDLNIDFIDIDDGLEKYMEWYEVSKS